MDWVEPMGWTIFFITIIIKLSRKKKKKKKSHLPLGLSKPIRRPNPPEEPDQNQFDPTTSVVCDESSPPEIDSSGSVSVSLPPKPETQLPARNPDSDEKNSRSQRKNLDSGNISRKFGGILTGSGKISSNPVRFQLDLAKSQRFR